MNTDQLTENYKERLAAHDDSEIGRAVVSDQALRRDGDLSSAQLEARQTAWARSTGSCARSWHILISSLKTMATAQALD